MKKILIILLALMMLCSCGTNKQAEEKTDDNPVQDNETVSLSISNNSPYSDGETTVTDFSKLLASSNGIEIYGQNDFSYVIPAEGMMEVILLIKNTNNYPVYIVQGSEYDVNSDNFSGSITEYCKDYTVIAHPNGSDFIIEANDELTYIFDISLPNFNNQDDSIEGDLIFSYEYRFVNNENGNEVADIDLSFNAHINYLGRAYRSIDDNRNAVIKGVVTDANSNPICDAEIEVFNIIDEGMEICRTNEKGEFELKVTAYKSSVTNIWHECVLKFTHPSYEEKYICVYPKVDQTNEVSLVLQAPSNKLSYTNTTVIDLGIEAYSYDTDSSKNKICFTPFHSGLNYDNVEDKVNLIYTDFDGNVLFKYHLNAETPWVCVSDDGKYVVTNQAVEDGNEDSTITTILNENGEVVYQKYFEGTTNTPQGEESYILQSRCAELSHNNNYLIIGSGEGDIYCLDWKNDTIVWTAETHGQVRYILFNDDDSKVYISSGDGYMYGFDIDGNQLFKTYVGSWATCMELADNYLVYGLKTAWGSNGCIDVTTGEKLWVCQALARGSGLAISKDKKYVWMGNDVSGSYSSVNNAIYDIKTGEIVYILNCDSAQQAEFSDDGKYLVVKNAKSLQVYETTNYSCVFAKTIVENEGQNTSSINQTIAVNADASKIVVAFNNDPSERCYGQAYYFTLD